MLVLYKKKKKRQKKEDLCSVECYRDEVRSSTPQILCCFQGTEMFLFWDNNNNNNTNYKKKYSNKKCDQITKVYMHIYTLYCATV